jgi:hypothetical protein
LVAAERYLDAVEETFTLEAIPACREALDKVKAEPDNPDHLRSLSEIIFDVAMEYDDDLKTTPDDFRSLSATFQRYAKGK